MIWGVGKWTFRNYTCTQRLKTMQTHQISTTRLAEDFVSNLILKFSSLSKLLRIVSYCLRWQLGNTLLSRCQNMLKLSKRGEFKELLTFRRGQTLLRRADLLCLNLFMDGKRLLRVGGRLENPSMSFGETPHHLCKVFTQYFSQLTRVLFQQKYCIVNCNNMVRKITLNCIKCARYDGWSGRTCLAPLPKKRGTSTYPLSVTGVDYAGNKCGQAYKSYKGCVFLFQAA